MSAVLPPDPAFPRGLSDDLTRELSAPGINLNMGELNQDLQPEGMDAGGEGGGEREDDDEVSTNADPHSPNRENEDVTDALLDAL